jgi:hypothetical protein
VRRDQEEPNPWKWFAVIVAGVLVGGFLLYQVIAWNEARGVQQAIEEMERDSARMEAEARALIVEQPQRMPRRTSIAADGRDRPAPLASEERCISGQRFRRVENGWEQIPNSRC